AGLHIYFLIRALQLLDERGRLAFIMPADTCEGVFASALWRWVTRRFCLDVVVTFDPDASPFPQVDTNPLIFLIRNAQPQEHFFWVRCHKPNITALKTWIRSEYTLESPDALSVDRRSLTEALVTGLSRPPVEYQRHGPTLGDFAKVMRGVATGANDFFFLTRQQAARLQIPGEFFVTAVGRTRDVPSNEINQQIIDDLNAKGRPTQLLSLSGNPVTLLPQSVRHYLQRGEELGLPQRPLISQRRPWYKMESRSAPPILFAYLGRRHSRFIRNLAGTIPLTSFLCVYPNQHGPDFIARLWEVLNQPETVANLAIIGKSYGAGAVKVEPRSLERLPLPEPIVRRVGLLYTARLLEDRAAMSIEPEESNYS
ncbi:MAG: SAM-dependent methyltransferase, partial [Chloroflexi bacterium]|nr:SAM-dependent methyltransferase [Chloroflexota bacterium]